MSGAHCSRWVTLDPEIAEAFLTEMRGHMETLDDIMAALAGSDFEKAATIAELRLGFGHRMWEAMAEQGMSEEEILAVRKAMQAQGMAQGQGRGPGQGQGQGRGLGRFMPESFRAMGQTFHEAGAQFADTARAMPAQPSAQDLSRVLGDLQQVTTICRVCHATFRVEESPSQP